MNAVIPEAQRTEILRRLHAAEQEHDVRILWGIESGSRAWGFASPNSDYDSRFIYVNRPEWYLSVGLEEQRDVIEYPIVDELDINGWDLRKALRLLWRSNPAFVEWIQSPIVYLQHTTFIERIRAILPEVYSPHVGIYHYKHMAKSNFRGYLQEEQVRIKKYFYVLRPLLAIRWLEQHQTPAPIEFDKLLVMIDGQTELKAAIDELLVLKRQSPELGLSIQIPAIQNFIKQELERLEKTTPEVVRRGDVLPLLNHVFHEVLKETWG